MQLKKYPAILLIILCSLHAQQIAAQVCFTPAPGSMVPVGYGTYPGGVESTDLNSDGKPDLLVTNYYNNSLSSFLGDGAGNFTPTGTTWVGSTPYNMICRDFNNDGKMDVVMLNFSVSNITILLGDGTGGFYFMMSFSVGGYPTGIAATDFNTDGKLDLIVASTYSVKLLAGDGFGGFSSFSGFAAGNYTTGMCTADYNADGKLDFAIVNGNSNNVSLYLGNGAGAFTGPTNFPVGSVPYEIVGADFNGDGKPDVATVNETSNNVTVLLGNGAGSFTPGGNFAAGTSPRNLTTGDYNNDGKPDIATTSLATNVVCILLGTGTGALSAPITITAGIGAGPDGITTADFNNDGLADIATANFYGDNASVLLNTLPIVTASATTTSICAGQLVTLTGAGAGTYSWTGGVTDGVPFMPTTTTTYTVTGTTTGGCSATATKTITVNTPPVTANATATSVFSGSSVTLTGGGAGTYSWSGGVTNGVPFVPAATATYTVTGINTMGCSATATVTVTVNTYCSIPFDYVVPPGGATTSALFGGLTTIANKNISVTGPLTVDNNILLSGCNVVISPSVAITLTTGNLSLTTQTHLVACSNMWSGIYVNSGRSLNTSASVLIEDAIQAVNLAQGATASINQTIFNRNLIAIELSANTSATSPLTVKSSIFTSRSIPTTASTGFNPAVSTVLANITGGSPYAAAILKAPYNDRKGCYGIEAYDVNRIDVGATIANSSNCFDAIMCGVSLNRSNGFVYNNRFQYLLGYPLVACMVGMPCIYDLGIGVKTTGTASGAYWVTVGGLAAYQRNTFYNTYRAVSIYDYQTSTVQNNSIDNTSTGPFNRTSTGYGNTGVYVKPSSANTINVSDNILIRNCETGIGIFRTTANSINSTAVTVENNTITSNSTGSAYCINGVTVQDYALAASTSAADAIKVRYNAITEAQNCVNAISVRNGLLVSQNTALGIAYDPYGIRSGVRLQNCENAKVTANCNIYCTTGYIYTNSYSNIRGIYVTATKGVQVEGNKITNTTQSLLFEQDCTGSTLPTYVRGNIFKQSYYGLYMKNSAALGTQGSPTVPSDNYYYGPHVYETYTDNTTNVNTNSVFYCRSNGGLPTVPTIHGGTNPYMNGIGIITIIASPFTGAACFTKMTEAGTEVENEGDISRISDEENSLQVYPNPANDASNAAYTLYSDAAVSLNIYNAFGVKLAELANGTQQAGTYTYSTGPLKPGIYFITLRAGEQVNSKRLVITEY